MKIRLRILVLAFCGLALLGAGNLPAQSVATEKRPKLIPVGRGQKPFDVTRHSIPLEDIQGGGPPRDGIPALVTPQFVSAEQVRGNLADRERVLGVFLNGEAKAYPIGILNHHELVNDTVGGRPVLVTW